MTLEFLFTIFLVFLNGFFVAAEFAIVKVRTSQIETRKNAGKAAAAAAKSVVSNLDGYLAATQLGITVASLGLGWVGEEVFTKIILSFFNFLGLEMNPVAANRLAIPVAFILITILHIVLGELAPKSLAIRKPVQVTFGVSIPLRIFYFVGRPFIWLLNGLANSLLKLIGIQPVHEQEDIHTEEELKVIIAESHKGGEIEETEKELIQNVFSLGDRRIQTLMTPRNEVVWVDINDDPEVIKKTILENKHTAYPLCEGNLDNVIGFIHTKDLVGQDFDVVVTDLKKISREVQVVISTGKAYSVLEKFQRQRVYQAVVVDEYGGVKGFVTLNDILDALVGDISETDEFEYASELQSDGSLIVDGQIPFVEFLEKIGLDDDMIDTIKANYITIAGYIIDELERIPEEGDIVKWENYTFEVLDMDHNRVDKVKVSNLKSNT
ncbi:MAG: hemolysin family protein [Dysgonamonadaceae bacterium]|jgi:putative hemolysin|nr:hemolysin family protein [Dysgonamonadaceae bacterium]